MLPLIVMLLGLLGGCYPKQPPENADLEPRFQAAMQIGSLDDKDSALKTVAIDAADLGAIALVKRALTSIATPGVRDEAASRCAIHLANVGQRIAANEVAGMIGNPGVRDSTLKKLAEGVE
jgi:hypothetical protein